MTSAQPETSEHRSDEFEPAWKLLDEATNVNRQAAAIWNGLVGTDLFSSSVHVNAEGIGRVDVFIDDFDLPRLDDLEQAARRFIHLLLACAREALLTAERCVAGAFRPSGSEHLTAFPLYGTDAEFAEFVESGALSGLRPDQVKLVEQFQPYYGAETADKTGEWFRRLLLTLQNLARRPVDDQARFVAFWAHSADPTIEAQPPAVVTDVEPQTDGLLVNSYCVATFRVPAGAAGVRSNPNIAFDPILNTEPWPQDPDDNMSARSRGLLAVVEELICALERSVGQRTPLSGSHFRILPVPDQDPLWARVDTGGTPDIEAGLRASDLGLATYRAGNEFVMLVQRPDGIYGRIVPLPEQLDTGIERGLAAEDASRDSASRWGLPDFMLEPEIVKRGNATREVGDGTIVCGDRGLAVQVKSRASPTDRPEREKAWLAKKTKEGARQAAGSVRTIQRGNVAHTNGRGRLITVDGNSIDWIGVVILDHDDPPDGLSFPVHSGLPFVAMLRREWEFIFDQLRSTTAVVNYLHRIAPDQISSGEHVANYYELALADEQTPPNLDLSCIPASLGDPALRMSHPVLPLQPASSADEYGARMYRQMLEDVARSPWDRDETDRLLLLHLLDRLPVAERAVVGRRLLSHLGQAPDVELGTTRWEARRYLLGDVQLHLGFVVSNQFTDLHREAFRQWVMLRHHEWTTALVPDVRGSASTAAVLLTPRHDNVRPWDTTVLAIFGDLQLEPDEVAQMQRLWNRGGDATDLPDA